MRATDLARTFREAGRQASLPKKTLAAAVLLFFVSSLYPSDMAYYSARQRDNGQAVRLADHSARFVNAAVAAGLPLLMGDAVGFVQGLYVAAGTTVATHLLKYGANNFVVLRTRLGERPYGRDSRNNMPSGHSSMASCTMFFVIRRYGRKYAWLLVPFTLLTMYARIALKAHTLSAVIAGCLLGIIVAMIFTSPLAPEKKDAAA